MIETRNLEGVVYFGDDDNAYDIRLFKELRKTTGVSVFGVGFSVGQYERCVVNPRTGKVERFATNWVAHRKFAIDMGGFAVHTRMIASKKPRFRNDWTIGQLENKFIQQLAHSLDELQPLMENCTRIFVWHVKTSGGREDVVKGDDAWATLRVLKEMSTGANDLSGGTVFPGHAHRHSHQHHHHDCCDDEKDDFDQSAGMITLSSPPRPEDLNIFQAAQHGFTPRVLHLLDSGAFHVNDVDAEGCSALHWAAINNRVQIVDILLARGADVDIIGGELQSTPLQWAARAGQIQTAALLIQSGADPTRFDKQGYNAMHLASHAGHAFMLLFLAAKGVDCDAPDSMGRTALMWCAYQGNSEESLRVMIKLGANIDRVDSTGMTALHWAVVSNHIKFSKLLIDAGADYRAKDPQGKTAGDWAQERGLGQMYNRILETRTGRGKTPFSPVKTARRSVVSTELFCSK
ncbi:Palmitoyltransferase Hip14 [Entophlyctis luteolus]|nr:Palmitoyltransferase Hip14 [Entophlyctis luteolus]